MAIDEAYGWDDCEGELELDIDDDGEVDGDGVCVGEDSGDWGGTDEYDLEFEGEIDADGNLSGVLVIEADNWGDVEMTVEGEGEEDDLEAEFEGEVTYEYWGSEYTLSLEGSFELERD